MTLGRAGLDSRIAADIARDLIELYDSAETPVGVRRRLRIELQRLEPALAAATRCPASPRDEADTVLALIDRSLEDVRACAAFLADF